MAWHETRIRRVTRQKKQEHIAGDGELTAVWHYYDIMTVGNGKRERHFEPAAD